MGIFLQNILKSVLCKQEVSMDKIEAIIITSSLEVRFEGEEKLLKEVENLQKHILEDDVINTAMDFGRLKEMARTKKIDEDEDMKKLHDWILLNENNANLDLGIGKLELTVRTDNLLRTGGINTVRQLISKSAEELKKEYNLPHKSVIEVAKKLKKLGFELCNN